MSKRKSGRDVHGIVLLDKRLGISSNRALQEVKRLFNANKAGHTGSLDPLATGLLPICLGEATKVSGLLLDDDKRYRVTVKLGVMTDTGDAEGEVIKTAAVPELSEDELRECLSAFVGRQEQVPPMYSALKQNGVKLYDLARQGKTVARQSRAITIHELTLQAFDGEQMILEVFCSKGTYIRSLAEDIGTALASCATVTALRRLQAGQFQITEAKTWEQLASLDPQALTACLLAVDLPLQALPAVHLSDTDARRIKHGQAVLVPRPGPGRVRVRLYHHSHFLALGELSMDAKITPKKLFNINNELPD